MVVKNQPPPPPPPTLNQPTHSHSQFQNKVQHIIASED